MTLEGLVSQSADQPHRTPKTGVPLAGAGPRHPTALVWVPRDGSGPRADTIWQMPPLCFTKSVEQSPWPQASKRKPGREPAQGSVLHCPPQYPRSALSDPQPAQSSLSSKDQNTTLLPGDGKGRPSELPAQLPADKAPTLGTPVSLPFRPVVPKRTALEVSVLTHLQNEVAA